MSSKYAISVTETTRRNSIIGIIFLGFFRLCSFIHKELKKRTETVVTLKIIIMVSIEQSNRMLNKQKKWDEVRKNALL